MTVWQNKVLVSNMLWQWIEWWNWLNQSQSRLNAGSNSILEHYSSYRHFLPSVTASEIYIDNEFCRSTNYLDTTGQEKHINHCTKASSVTNNVTDLKVIEVISGYKPNSNLIVKHSAWASKCDNSKVYNEDFRITRPFSIHKNLNRFQTSTVNGT